MRRLWFDGTGVLSTQALRELTVNLRRKALRPADARTTREIIADYLAWEVVAVTAAAVLEAMDLETKYRISFWDALILWAAEICGAEILYSEDFSSGATCGGVRVLNPLQPDSN